MSKKMIQIERCIRLACGFFLFPIFLITAMFTYGINDYNFTGLLNWPGHRLIFCIGAVIILIWMVRCISYLGMHTDFRPRLSVYRIHTAAFGICALTAILVPYIEGSICASIHLLFAYCAFIIFNIILYETVFVSSHTLLYGYTLICFFCVLLCCTAGQITGLAELIYACMCSVLLAYTTI